MALNISCCNFTRDVRTNTSRSKTWPLNLQIHCVALTGAWKHIRLRLGANGEEICLYTGLSPMSLTRQWPLVNSNGTQSSSQAPLMPLMKTQLTPRGSTSKLPQCFITLADSRTDLILGQRQFSFDLSCPRGKVQSAVLYLTAILRQIIRAHGPINNN